jgi:hypothetical protein
MWDHLPIGKLQPPPPVACETCLMRTRYANLIHGRRKDALGQALDQMVTEKILRGWLPLVVEADLGEARRWRITPTHGPAQTYDRPGIEAFLRMVAAMG